MLTEKKFSIGRIGLVAAFMMLVIMLPSMILNHGIFIVRGDYVDQYIPRLIKSREIFLTGKASWDWYNFLGNQYNPIDTLCSLNAVCMLFPTDAIPYAVTYMHLVRVAIIAMTAMAYLKLMVKSEKTAFIGALLYTFSSYTFINFEFIQFLEALWTFPLLLLAVEKMFRQENYKHLLIPAVFLSCAVSFYIFVFSTISFSVYFVCRFFFSEEWKPKRKTKYFLWAILEYVIGMLCAAFVIVPFVYKMFNSSGSTEDVGKIGFSIKHLFISGTVVSRAFSMFVPAASNRFSSFGTSNWSSTGAYIPVFGLAFAAAFVARKNEEKWLKILCIVSVVFIMNAAVSMVYNVFSSEYLRYVYAMVLFLTLATVKFLENYDEKIARRWAYVTVALFAVMVAGYYAACFVFANNEHLMTLLKGPEANEPIGGTLRLFALTAAVLMYGCLLAFVHSEKVRKHIVPGLIAVITIYGCCYSVMNNNSANLMDHYADSKMNLQTQVEKYFVDKPQMDEGRDYRIDASKHCRNYAYAMKKPSITTFESVRNSYSCEMAGYLNIRNADVSSIPEGPENATRTLLGVKYYYDLYPADNAEVPEGFSYIKTDNGVDVYENDSFMGMGFSYENYITRSQFEKIAQKTGFCGDFMLDTLVIEDEDENAVSGLLKPYEEGAKTINRKQFDEFRTDSGGFTASFTSDKPEIVFISVPYEKSGWTAEINGKPAEFIRANVGCVALKTASGKNEIKMEYSSPSLRLGLQVAAGGWILAVIYILICLMKRKKFSKN